MKSKKDLINIIEPLIDKFLFKSIVSSDLSEKQLLIFLLKNGPTKEVISTNNILEYILKSNEGSGEFIDEELKLSIISYGNYRLMYELIKKSNPKLFDKNELQKIYSEYNNREIRELVECNLWLYI